MLKHLFWLFFCMASLASAQNNALLKQQYRRGPVLNRYFKKLNFEFEAYTVIGTIQQFKTKPQTDYAGGGRIVYRFAETLGLTAGANYFNLSYRFDYKNNNSIDRITYFSFPFSIRVFSGDAFSFEFGANYNQPIKGTNKKFPEEQEPFTVNYPDGTFKPTFGILAGFHAKVAPQINLAVQFRVGKRIVDSFENKNNNTVALMLGAQYYLRKINGSRKTQRGLGFPRRR